MNKKFVVRDLWGKKNANQYIQHKTRSCDNYVVNLTSLQFYNFLYF